MRTQKDRDPRHQAAATLLLVDFPTINPENMMEALRRHFAPGPAALRPPDELLSIRAFSEKASCSRATVFRQIKAGKIPTVRIGQRGTRIPAAVLARMIATTEGSAAK